MIKSQIVMVLVACIFYSCTKETSSLDGLSNISKAENVVAIEQELLTVVNTHRTGIGKAALEFSEVAYEYANKHNDYQISKGTINHDNFSSRASKISELAEAELVAENVAKDFDSAAGAFQVWYESSSHKSTMEGDFTHTAVSVKVNDEGKLYFTQIFFRK